MDIDFIGVINVICIIYYVFSCSFFGLTPAIERIDRIRYLLKMNGVSALMYIPTLLIPDFLICLGLVIATYAISYIATKDYYREATNSVFYEYGINLLSWLCTFIVQSYCLSFAFSVKRSAIKSLNWVYIGLNLALAFILGLLADMSS